MAELDLDPTLFCTRAFPPLVIGFALAFVVFGGEPVFKEGGFFEDKLQFAEGFGGGDADWFIDGWKGVSE